MHWKGGENQEVIESIEGITSWIIGFMRFKDHEIDGIKAIQSFIFNEGLRSS